jgi:hypothetical protein
VTFVVPSKKLNMGRKESLKSKQQKHNFNAVLSAIYHITKEKVFRSRRISGAAKDAEKVIDIAVEVPDDCECALELEK